MLTIACAHCGRKLKIKPSQAGRSFNCPACHQPVTVPQAAGEATLDSGPQAPGQPAAGEASAGNQGSAQQTAAAGAEERYQFGDEIGRGGMGAVVRALDRGIRREVAVKFLLREGDGQQKTRFIEEAQITGQLEHPNIVPVHELGVDAEGRCYFTMKLVRGRSLKEVLDELRSTPQQSEWTLARLLGVLVNVCHALAYAHSRDVVHRDLKPANIMVGDFGEVYVMDWGLAKVLASAAADEAPIAPADPTITVGATFDGNESESAGNSGRGPSAGAVSTHRPADTALTMDGSVLGTPVYMSPEQAAGKINEIDRLSDVYSLGAILYELLTLFPPVEKEGGHVAVLGRVIKGEITPPEKRSPVRAKAGQIPNELSAVAMKALALRREDRYPTAADLRRDIELFLEGRSVSAKHDSAWEQARKFIRRNKAVSTATAIAATLLVAVLGVSSWINYQARVRAENSEAAVLTEQEKNVQQGRESVPAFVRAARLALEQRQFDDAMTQLDTALKFDADHAEARFLRAQILIVRKDYAAAIAALEAYASLQPDDLRPKTLIEACRGARAGDDATLWALANAFTEQKAYPFADGVMQEIGANAAEARGKLFELYRKRLENAWPNGPPELKLEPNGTLALSPGRAAAHLIDLAPLRGIPLTSVDLAQCSKVQDLSPLKGMALRSLVLVSNFDVHDLTPLQGMPLEHLQILGCKVSDLRPLAGLQLTSLDLRNCPHVKDLSILSGMPLQSLLVEGPGVQDLSPIRGAPLKRLYVNSVPLPDSTILQGMPLEELTVGNSNFSDLTPLSGMPLRNLHLATCATLRNLAPLRGLVLHTLYLSYTTVDDLTPLQGMPLRSLVLYRCNAVRDLSPLKQSQLESLSLVGADWLSDLTMLDGFAVKKLNLGACSKIHDLRPLAKLPLTHLDVAQCEKIDDLTPLGSLRLEELHFTPKFVKKGIDTVRGMKSLARIGGQNIFGTGYSATEFWERFDRGEFNK